MTWDRNTQAKAEEMDRDFDHLLEHLTSPSRRQEPGPDNTVGAIEI